MNRRIVALFGLVLGISLVMARAGVARGQGIPNEAKTANNITSYRDAINTFISQQVAKLSGTESAERSKAREQLILESNLRGASPGQTPSAAFLAAYPQALNQQLMAVIQNKESSNIARMNAAMVAAMVARNVNNAVLAPTISAAVQDPADEVVLWGLKGAKYVVPELIKINPKDPLLAAIIDAVKKHSQKLAAGAIASAAYEALTLDLLNPLGAKALVPAQFQAAIPAVQDLLEAREQIYIKGVPPMASADSFGTRFLSDQRVWPLHTPQQQTRSIQLMSNVVSLAAQQMLNANEADRIELATAISRVAAAISVAAQSSGATALAQAAYDAAHLSPRGVPPAQFQAKVQAIYPAIKSSGKFAAVNEPPAIQSSTPAPAASMPASIPTTSGAVVAATQPAR